MSHDQVMLSFAFVLLMGCVIGGFAGYAIGLIHGERKKP